MIDESDLIRIRAASAVGSSEVLGRAVCLWLTVSEDGCEVITDSDRVDSLDTFRRGEMAITATVAIELVGSDRQRAETPHGVPIDDDRSKERMPRVLISQIKARMA